MTSDNTDLDYRTAEGFRDLRVTVRNVGGISDGVVSIPRGITLLSGENASNKSSFLRGLSAVLGAPAPTLKSDAEEGFVRLETDESDYYVELASQNGQTAVSAADQFSDETRLCELFVSLDETNPIRQAVVGGDDLYELLMDPLDVEEIEAEIEDLQSRRANVDDRLGEISRMEDRLPTLRTRAKNLEEEIADVETSLARKRVDIEDRERENPPDEGVNVLDELKRKRTEREQLRSRIQTQQDAIASLRDDLENVSEQIEEFRPSEGKNDVEELETEIEQHHYRKQQLTSTINALSPIVEMNAQLLDDDEEIPEEMKAEDIVSELDPQSKTITCWTCGNTVEQSQIADQVSVVKEILDEKRSQREMVDDRIQSLETEKQLIQKRRDERDDLEDEKQSIEREIERREGQLEDLQSDRSSLQREIDELQAEAEELDGKDDEMIELHSEVSDLEYERGRLETDLEAVEAEIEEIETALAERDDLRAERESISVKLQEECERIETVERDLVTEFNESMQRVIDEVAYENVERVWIERLVDGDGRTSSQTEFELHVVRTNEDGAAYEDTIETLSKSEREVIGLVVALAGYLAHNVAAEVPVVVIDAVEMFDAERIRGLLDYFEQYAEYVVAAVLPEEAGELDDTYPRITTSSSFEAEP
jgi:chromosome segregation ATPase